MWMSFFGSFFGLCFTASEIDHSAKTLENPRSPVESKLPKARVCCRLWSDSTGARGRSPLGIQLFMLFTKLHLRFISVDPVNRVYFQYPMQHDCNLDLNLKNDFFSIFPPCYYDPVNSLQEIKSENILKSLFYSIFIKNLQDRQI